MSSEPSAAGAAPRPATARGHVPGEEGVWVLIGGDMLIFGLFFLTYMAYRADDVGLFTASQELLDRRLGLLNTLLLLTSSLFVAQAVAAVRRSAPYARGLLLAAIAFGSGFVVVKAFEYGAKISHGITLNTNIFFIFYYMFTGIHLVHVLIGLGVLVYLATRFERGGRWAAGMGLLEGSAAFWHLVDLLWIVLFALLYLIR